MPPDEVSVDLSERTWALLPAGEYLSVPASVGFIALSRVAVLNGVVMVTHFNHLQAAGQPIARAGVARARA